MKKQLYLAIKNRLKNIPSADGEPLFKHFDLWNQQVEFIEQETPFQTPAIFVEFMPLQWRTRTIPNHNHERYVDSVEEYICKVVDNSTNTPMTGVNGDVIVPEKRYVTLAPVVTKDND